MLTETEICKNWGATNLNDLDKKIDSILNIYLKTLQNEQRLERIINSMKEEKNLR